MNSLNLFLKGRPRNLLVSGDAYTISGNAICSPESKKYSQYYFANRYTPKEVWPEVAKDSRMVLYGLSDFIRNNLTQPFTREDVNEAACFMNQAHIGGGPLPFQRDLFDWCVDNNNGYLPIKIMSLPEASTFFPNEPVITVENTVPGFGEIAAHIEALLVGYVSTATARVTRARHWLERIIDWYKLDNSKTESYLTAQWVIHDFGMRASSCGEESELLGKAHLLVFNGTDTFNAAYQAWRMGANKDSSKSILALAHRIVQGFNTEDDCFNHLSSVSGIGSYVADCYNYKEAVIKLISLAKENKDKIYVIRPDSGSHIENINYTIRVLKENDMVGKNVRYLDGDSVNPVTMKELIDECWKAGINPSEVFGTFGIGGDLRNHALRDSLSSSYKLCCVGDNYRPVVKLSEVIGKMSVPGPNHLTRNRRNNYSVEYGHHISDSRKVFYNGTEHDLSKKFTECCYEDFSVLQYRCIKQFNEMSTMPVDFGTVHNTCLSPQILQIQQEYKDEYR